MTEASSETRNPDFGHLIAKGWRQGVMFDAPAAMFAFNSLPEGKEQRFVIDSSRMVRAKERLVLVSHDCDINNRSEHYVEAMICKRVDPEKRGDRLAQIDRNSPRQFVVDTETAYVAEACYRVLIAKQVLESLEPMSTEMDPYRFLRFREWLARRYDRPAVPDELHEHFLSPVYACLDQLGEEDPETTDLFNAAVHEMRVTYPDDVGLPLSIGLVMLLRGPGISAEATVALDKVAEAIEACVDPANAIIHGTEYYELDDAPYGVILKSEPLTIEYMSYEGDDSAAPPPWLHAVNGRQHE